VKRSAILAMLAVALVAAAGLGVYFTGKPRLAPIAPQTSEDDQRVQITRADIEDIQTMELQSESRSLRFYRDGQQWRVEHPDGIRLDPSLMQDLAFTFGRLYAEKVIDRHPADRRQFGLDPPRGIGRATLKDGTVIELHLGDETPARNTWYLMVRGDPAVYAVWANHAMHLGYSLEDVRQRALARIEKREIGRLKILRAGNLVLDVVETSAELRERYPYLQSRYALLRSGRPPRAVDPKELLKSLGGFPAQLKIARFVDDHPQSLTRYGLDRPRLELLIRDRDNSLHLLFGADADESLVYTQTAGQKSVFALRKDELDVLQATSFQLMEKLAFIVPIGLVDRIRLEYDNMAYGFDLIRLGQGQEPPVIYLMDGTQVEEKHFKRLYQSFIGLTVEGQLREPVTGKPEVELIYTLNGGKLQAVRLSFLPYNQDFYALLFNGAGEFLISRQQLLSMLREVQSLQPARANH
jgi:hypothetical protein